MEYSAGANETEKLEGLNHETTLFDFHFNFTLLFLAVIYWLRPVKQAAVQIPATQGDIQSASNIPMITNNAKQNTSIQPSPVSAPPINPKVGSNEEKTERLVHEANAKYETPIEFYGQVIDQDSNFLSGVKIKASIYYEHLFAPTTSNDYKITNNLIHLERDRHGWTL